MKTLKNKLIAFVLAGVTAFTVSASAYNFAPVMAYAASGEQFLSDVALVYEDDAEDVLEEIEGTDWKLYDKDLNPNNDITIFDDGVYLVYNN